MLTWAALFMMLKNLGENGKTINNLNFSNHQMKNKVTFWISNYGNKKSMKSYQKETFSNFVPIKESINL